MRECLRCKEEMIEGLTLGLTTNLWEVKLCKNNFFKSYIEQIKSAVCPKCGYVELYIDNIDFVKKQL